MESKKLRWSLNAIKQLNKALDYIEKDSIKNAQRVADDISKATEKLIRYPEIYSPDKYKRHNVNHNYRAFQLHKYRISCHIKKKEILILKLRHTSRKHQYY